MKVDVFVGLVRLHWFFTEKIHKLKVQLSDPRVTQERDVVITAPVRYVVHTHTRIPANKEMDVTKSCGDVIRF